MSSESAQQQLVGAMNALKSNRPADAEQICRQVLQANPNEPDALHFLGLSLLQQQRLPESIQVLSRAAELVPKSPEILANFGNALRAANRMPEAAAALERAIALKPDYAIALSNLGIVRRATGEIGAAIAVLQRAVRAAPNLIAAWMNLGNALRDAGKPDDAANAFRRALQVNPNLADAHSSLATLLGAQGRFPAAIESFRTALRIDPKHVPTLINFALLLRQQNDFDAAIQHLSTAVQLAPNSADAHEQLARMLWSVCRLDDALSHFQRSYELGPTPRRKLQLATLIPPVYASNDDVTKWRNRLEHEVDALHAERFRFDITNEAPPSIVYLPYQGLDDRAIAERIAALCTIAQAPRESEEALPFRARSEESKSSSPFSTASFIEATDVDAPEKVTVGFLSSLFKDQTVGLWMQGLIAQLDRTRFEVVVLSTANWTDRTGTFIREHCDRYIVLPRSLAASRKVVGDLNLDVLIFSDFGMDPWTAALAHSKLARVQCLTWGHPITSGLKSIDYFLSHVHAENDGRDSGDPQSNYTEKLVRFEHLPVYYHRPRPPSLTATRGEFDLRADAHVYGCLQAQYKLHPAFDQAIAGILRRDPNGIVLFSQTGTARADHIIRQRLQSLAPDVVDRVRFMPPLERDRFRALVQLCDVLLAPFPFGAGDSALEGFALGLPTVTLPTPYLKGRLTYAMYKLMKIDDAIARDVEDYVRIATELGTDRAKNESLRARIRSQSAVLFDNPAGVREVEAFLIRTLSS